MFGIDDILIRLARSVLDSVLSQLGQQLNIVQEQAMSPIKAMVQQVTSGVWVGDGANAFVEEVSSFFIPGVEQISNHITTTSGNINFARDVIDRADAQVSQLVSSQLMDTFKFY